MNTLWLLRASCVAISTLAVYLVVRSISIGVLNFQRSSSDARMAMMTKRAHARVSRGCEPRARLPNPEERLAFYAPEEPPCGTVAHPALFYQHERLFCLVPRAPGPKTLYEAFLDWKYDEHRRYVSEIERAAGGASVSAMTGDGFVDEGPCPLLVKVRQRGRKNNVVSKMDWLRHFKSVPEILEEDVMPFMDKSDVAVWNGATTGWRGGQRWHLLQRIRNRTYHGSPLVSAGVSAFVGPTHPRSEFYRRRDFRHADIGRRSIHEMSRHKMIIDAEGNDFSTGLPWKLASSSAVIMPHPTLSSWLMEERLVPWVHYIPVQQDFGDLEEAVGWCLAHLDACEQIGRNGRCWILPFLDTQAEHRLLEQVVKFSTPCEPA